MRLSRWDRFRAACAWRLRVTSVLFLIALAISPVKDSLAGMEALQARLRALCPNAARHESICSPIISPKSIRSGSQTWAS